METTVLEIVSPAFELDKISAQAAALAKRDELLTKARKGTAITSAEQATRAAAFLKDLATFTRTIEDTRAAVKAPILEAGKKIDAVARTLTVDLEAEAKRIGGLLATFQAEQKRKEEEARRKAWEEQERIRLDAERKEREAREKAEADERERQRKVREEQEARDKAAREEQDRIRAAAERTRSEAGRAKREQELRDAQEKAEREKKEAADRAERERIEREDRERADAEKRRQEAADASAKASSAVVPIAKKIEGVAVGSEIKFEVTDIEALREAHPMFVLLSPNNAAIKAALKTMGEGKSLPGVRHWREAKTVIR
jgi:hypothetical protein